MSSRFLTVAACVGLVGLAGTQGASSQPVDRPAAAPDAAAKTGGSITGDGDPAASGRNAGSDAGSESLLDRIVGHGSGRSDEDRGSAAR